MSLNEQRLVWIDMEMTGLDVEKERIIEVAMIITEPDLTVVYEAPVWVIHQSSEILDKMDAWNKGTHGGSGLIDKVKASDLTEEKVEDEIINILSQYVPKGKALLCGNSIAQDRLFIKKYMPKLDTFLHYRMIDVTTLKELARRWAPQVFAANEQKKSNKHQALQDIRESIEELKCYREHFIAL
ncbi:oligoribonuclease [Basilea psittacipulmonis]|uniref:Oligoribonuclease n=1 Tax=Basilea psittacipulmonis DSM 24701 TaxID=1072685 RepID=A0A077DG34_9BURK|nr:oligoribonuclease [Basilea psittacipulmonis]AIL33136.1 oligoribonuclease [Basilea psittacipulmonis DSM 24701]